MKNNKLYNRIINSIARQVKRTLNESIDFDEINNDDDDIIEQNLVYKLSNFVDLGLPSETWWSKCNLGANKPEEYGLYYQWGSLEGHKLGTFDVELYDYYKHHKKKYYGLNELREDDDAAYVESNGLARIPTKELIQELIDNCKYEWTKLNGVKGSKFTGSNGNSIFIPATGMCDDSSVSNVGSSVYIWSLSLHSTKHQIAYNMFCSSLGAYIVNNLRYIGFSIRAVCTL